MQRKPARAQRHDAGGGTYRRTRLEGWMVKLNLILILVLVAAALSVVSARHQARKLFVTLQSEQAHARDLDIEWGQLQLEISTWLMHNRVEEVARTRLHMTIPAAGSIYVLQKENRP
jgi:cell division protein FtsL